MPERGCGKRRKGLYLEIASGPGGLPLEHFLLDPPVIPEDFDFKSLPNRTRFLEDTNTVMHWVGERHYPYVTDMIEEIRLQGGSFRIPLSFDVERLGRGGVSHDRNGEPMLGARMLLAHARCYNNRWREQQAPTCESPFAVIQDGHQARAEGPCLYKCYDLVPERAGEELFPGAATRLRRIGDTLYTFTPSGEDAAGLVPAFFASLPLRGLAAIRGDMSPAEEQQWERARARAREAGVPIRTLSLGVNADGEQVEIEDGDED